MTSVLYNDRQSTYPVFFVIFIIECLFCIGFSVYAYIQGDFEVIIVSLIALVVLGIIFVSFLWMQVFVYDDRLTVRYGFFNKTIFFKDIRKITVEPYDFWKYGGWGIRWNWTDHSTAWVTRSGVGIQMHMDRKACFISVREPEKVFTIVRGRLAQ